MSQLPQAIGEFLLLALLAALVPGLLAADVIIYGKQRFVEMPLTEISQQVMLLIAAILLARQAVIERSERGFYALLSGLIACMLIRELDDFFDAWVGNRFWVYPAVAMAITACSIAIANRRSIATGINAYLGSRAHTVMLLGMVTVLVLSRTLGSGDLLWEHVFEDQSTSEMAKKTVQEGLEHFGYLLIAYSALLTAASQPASRRQQPT